MRESLIERRLKNEVEKRGGDAYKFTVPGVRGVPDRIILLPDARTVFVELKAPGKKPTPLQQKRARHLQAMGYPVYCIDSMAGVEQFITEVFGA